MGDLAPMCAAVLQHFLKLCPVIRARGFGVNEFLQDGQSITFAAIFDLARLRRKIVSLVCLLRCGYADVEDGTGHAQSIRWEYAMVNTQKDQYQS